MPRLLLVTIAFAAASFAQTKSTFQASRINVGCNPLRVLTGDYNGDHKVDLMFQCSAAAANPIMVVAGNGDGTFGTPISVSAPAVGTGTGNKLVVADFDHDGRSDLAYVASNGNVVVLLSAGDGTFKSVVTTPANLKLSLAAAADLDGNGFPDLVFISNAKDSLVTYAYGKGDGTFGTPIVEPWPDQALVPTFITPNPQVLNIITADFNGDGRPDLTVAVQRTVLFGSNSGSPISEVRIFNMFGKSGGFGAPVVASLMGDSQMLPADFNGDGKLDIAFWGPESIVDTEDVYIYHSFANGGNGPSNSNVSATAQTPIQAGDLNGEGKARLLVGSTAFNAVIIYTEDQLPTAVNSGFVDLGTSPVDIAVADFNGDGKLDFVTANSSSATIGLNTTVILPQIAAAINGASFATGQPLAPGSLGSLFGNALTTVPVLASSIPLPLSMGQFSLTVGGVPAPLTYVSATQVNFQVPWTVPPGPADMIATVNGTPTAKITVTIGAVDPGIFSLQFGSGQAIAINLDGTLAAPVGSIPGLTTHPAKPGDTILVLGTGLGAVTPAIPTGAASGDTLTNTVVKPAVLIGGAQAQVAFSGLTPQFVGVNQLNVVVPQVPAGVVSLQIDAGGVRTSDKVTIAVANP